MFSIFETTTSNICCKVWEKIVPASGQYLKSLAPLPIVIIMKKQIHKYLC